MEDELEVELGGVKVPAAFKARWDELIGKNREYKAQVLELSAEAQTAKTAKNPEFEAAKARIAELEGTIKGHERSMLLSPDGIDADAELTDYLDYQYDRLKVADGEEKPSFSDWYRGIRETNAVIKSAIASKVATKTEPETKVQTKVQTKVDIKPEPKVDIKPEQKATAPKLPTGTRPAASEGLADADTIASMDSNTFRANKANIRKQLGLA